MKKETRSASMDKFYITGTFGETQVFPVPVNSFALKYVSADGEVFKRKQLQGALRFMGADYELIMSQTTDKSIQLRITFDDSDTSDIIATFTIRASSVNIDNQAIEVTPIIVDGYEQIMTVLDREVNWLNYQPQIKQITIPVFPLIQIYEIGSDKITCFGRSGYWTQIVENIITNAPDLKNKYHFGEPKDLLYLSTNAAMTSYVFDINTWKSSDNRYAINNTSDINPDYDPQDPWDTLYYERIEIWEEGSPLFVMDHYAHPSQLTHEYIFTQAIFYKVGGTETATFSRRRFVCRLVSSNGKGPQWSRVLTDDIMPQSIYQYAVQLPADPVFAGTDYEDEENRYWGHQPHYAFFPKTPANHPSPGNEILVPFGINCFPVDPESWRSFSVWFEVSSQHKEWVTAERYTEMFVLKDAYTFQGVINAFLLATGVSLSFDIDTDSEFLKNFPFVITPKGNIVVWRYTHPTTVNNMTLGQLLETLKKLMQVYWYVEDGHIKFEHISYFRKGGTYDGVPEVDLDLTQTYDMRNYVPLSYGLNSITYENMSVPFGVQYRFADECSFLFNGFGIQYYHSYYPGIDLTIEKVEIETVSTDIQHALVNPDRYSKEGLFFLQDSSGVVPFETFELEDDEGENPSYTLLNGKLSMLYLLDRYHRDDLLKWVCYINTMYRELDMIKYTIRQSIDFPHVVEIDWLKAYVTDIGIGLLEEAVVDLDTGYVTGVIKHYETQTSE